MFHLFTEKAIAVVMLAQDESTRVRHNRVDTEQFLVGLLRVPSGCIAGTILKKFGVELRSVRAEVARLIGKGSDTSEALVPGVEIPFTPGAKWLMESAWEAGKARGHYYIGTEHLLAGLLHQNKGTALEVLKNLRIPIASIELELEERFGSPRDGWKASEAPSYETEVKRLQELIASLNLTIKTLRGQSEEKAANEVAGDLNCYEAQLKRLLEKNTEKER